jgi:hypothetical protein
VRAAATRSNILSRLTICLLVCLCLCLCLYVCVYLCVFVSLCVFVCVWVCVCLCLCVFATDHAFFLGGVEIRGGREESSRGMIALDMQVTGMLTLDRAKCLLSQNRPLQPWPP